MIAEITIRDLGVIGQATLPLGPGFTAVTGETGAGKTMVVTALGLLLGARADSGAVRQGSERAVVEGRGIIAADGPVPERVRDAGGDVDPFGDGTRGELIVTRQLSSEGRSRASVGGRGAPAALLTEIGEQLVVVHGQSDQMRLRSSTAQRQALDRFAGSALAPVHGEYQEVFRRWQAARAELDRLVTEQDARTREAQELRIAIDAIEAVAPQPGEDEELRERIDRLTNLEDLRAVASAAHELMSSEDASGEMADAASVLDTAHRRLDRVAAHDPGLAEIIESLDSARILVSEIAVQLSGYLAGLDADGARELETLQDRRAELAALTRAHGPTVEDALAFLDTGSARLLELDGDTDRIDLLRVEVERDELLVGELAARVTAVREEAGARLAAAVTTELGALAMADASLEVRVSPREEPALSGADRVEILLRPHAGAEARPLGRGASGGELSRVMLAIEVVGGRRRPRAHLRVRRGRRRRRRRGGDRDRATAGTAGGARAGHRRHAPRAGRGLLDQPPARRQGRRRPGHRVERHAARGRRADPGDGAPALRPARQRERAGARARARGDGRLPALSG